MENKETIIKSNQHTSLFSIIRSKILLLFRLTNEPVVKIYHGFGTQSQIIVFGHIFRLSPLPRIKLKQNFWTNTFALFRSFMVRGISNKTVVLTWENKTYQSTTASDGFFRFEFHAEIKLVPGTYTVQIDYVDVKQGNKVIMATGYGSVIVPYENKFAVISDIDDTFLISHSSNLRRKLYVLLTKNAHSRKPFEGVVRHYQLLSNKSAANNNQNPFFYVSSSEWNLYEFIKEFCRKNDMPEGVFLLSQLKRFSEVWKTGGNKHATKFMRIARILEAYPTQKFVLMGDDSQQDPTIYESIVSHFPGRIVGVYLRHVYPKNISNVTELIKKMEKGGIPVCHFVHSKEAIEHSYSIGLISTVLPR